MPWIGQKKVAFVPVARPRMDVQPADWEDQILSRIYYDPTPAGDVSFRTFIQRVSHGRADIEGIVLPRVEIDQVDVPVGILGSRTAQLRAEGFDGGAIVMLGGPGAGSAERLGFWARFVMAEGVGVWAMELMHILAQYGDLYIGSDHLDSFDTMAGVSGSHMSAYSKRALGWLDAGVITQHSERLEAYHLHDVGLPQPPPGGRITAVEAAGHVIEAREMVDQFDSRIKAKTAGAPSEGVIVYKVESPDVSADALLQPHLRLKTPDPLQPGDVFKTENGVVIQVTKAIPGGYSIRVEDPFAPFVMQQGQLLFYRDDHRDGTGDVHGPSVIGLGGWQVMQHLTYGGDGILYAVDDIGRLLFYRDATRDGLGDLNTPAVIGQNGWQSMSHLFAGDPGVLYAVNEEGQLLFYRDNARDGTGDVSSPSIIGQSGWHGMRHVFYGGEGIIYAVNDMGQLLFYRDTARDGTGDVSMHTVIGQGGWQAMKHLFYGGDGIIYAVDDLGQLLFYRDATRDGTGDISTHSVIGQGGWQAMKHLVAGDPGVIYAAVA